MNRLVVGVLALAVAASAGPAQPDDELKRAAEKYERAIADAEQALRAGLEKAAEKAKDKAARAKLAYEVERFERLREVPGAVPAKDYVRARDAAVAALSARFEPAIKAKRAAKDPVGVEQLEVAYGKLLRKGRGFGLAVPDPAANLPVVVRCKAGGGVLEPADPRGDGSRVAVVKYAKGRAAQLWRVERGEDGFALRSAVGGLHLHVPASSRAEGERLVLWRSAESPPNAHFSWKAEERGREAVLVSSFNGLALTAKEVTEKGEVRTLAVQDVRAKTDVPDQVWTLEVQK